jgi:hypothetical protein
MIAIRLSAFLLLAAIGTAQQSSASGISEPKLPVANDSACPGKGHIVPNWKITHSSPMYSSWQDDRTQTAALELGEDVAVVAGVQVIRQPDRILATQPIPDLHLKPGDIVLRFNRLGEGAADIWASGTWHKNYDASFTTEKNGLGCRRHCLGAVIEEGVRENWVQVKTSSGQMGWVLNFKVTRGELWDSGNFDDLCAAEPTSD